MRRAMELYVHYVDAMNRAVGYFAMYLFYALGAVLIYATLSRVVAGVPVNWALEMSQFILSAYYLLGGAYSMQLNGHVRMDLIYGRFTARQKAVTDAITIFCVIFYLIVLFIGGISSTNYAIAYKQQNYSAWAPLLWPIKVVMTVGVFLMLLQTISSFFKDVAEARGRPIA